MAGTDNELTMIKIYLTQPNYSDINSIFDKTGSKGNSAILLPNFVNLPCLLSNAPKTQSSYSLLKIVRGGGGSIKSKSLIEFIFKLLSNKIVLLKLVL